MVPAYISNSINPLGIRTCAHSVYHHMYVCMYVCEVVHVQKHRAVCVCVCVHACVRVYVGHSSIVLTPALERL